MKSGVSFMSAGGLQLEKKQPAGSKPKNKSKKRKVATNVPTSGPSGIGKKKDRAPVTSTPVNVPKAGPSGIGKKKDSAPVTSTPVNGTQLEGTIRRRFRP